MIFKSINQQLSLWASEINVLLKGGNRNFNTLIFLLVVNVLIAAIGFATKIKMANVLGATNFGVLSYGIAIATYIETLVRYGTDKTLVRDIVHQEHKTAEILVVTLMLKLLLLFSCLSLLFIYSKIGQRQNSDLAIWVIIGSSMIALEAKGAYDATDNIRRHSIYFASYRFIFFLLIWGYILTCDNQLTVDYVGFGMIISACIYLSMQYRWIFLKYWKKIKPVWIVSETWELIKTNSFVCFAALFGLGFTSFNQLVLKKYCGAKELGVYAAAWQFFWVGNIFIMQISRIGQPILARKLQLAKAGRAELFLFVIKYLVVMVLTILPISVPMIVFPDFIISTLFSQEYFQSVTPLRLIGLYLIILSGGIVFSQYIIISRKDKLYMFTVLLAGISSMIIAWLIIPKYQATGAAISLVVSHGFAIILYGIIAFNDIFHARGEGNLV